MAAAEQLRLVVEETASLIRRLEQGAEGPMAEAWSRASTGIAACIEGVAEAQQHRDPLGLADRLEHELAVLVEALAPSLGGRPG